MNRGGKDRVNTMHFHLQLFQSLLFTAGMHPQLATSIADEKMVESIPSSIVLRPETLSDITSRSAAVLAPYGRAAAADLHSKRTEVLSKQDRLRTNMAAENRSGIDQVQGVWVASDVKEQRLEGGVRVFKLTSQHVVVVMPLPARRHVRPQQQLDQDCDTGWEPFLAYSDDKIPTFACSPTTR